MTRENEDQEIPEKNLKQHTEWMILLREEWKIRRSREFILMTICIIVLLYTYPIDINANSSTKIKELIEISPLSIKIPLADAIAIFPTIITAIYLVYLSSSLKLIKFTALAFGSLGIESTYKEDRMNRVAIIFIPAAVTMADPDKPIPLSGFSAATQLIVLLFVSLIFAVFPYAMIALSTIRSWQLLNNSLLLIWNLVCISIMLLAVAGQIFGTSKKWGVVY
jgi:hypothetical protein